MNRYEFPTFHRTPLPTPATYAKGDVVVRITPRTGYYPGRLKIERRLHEEAWLTYDVSYHVAHKGVYEENSFIIEDRILRLNYRHE